MKLESQKQARKQNYKQKLLSILISSALSTTAFASQYSNISENNQISGETPIGHEVKEPENIVTGDVNISLTPLNHSIHTYPKGLIIRSDRTENIQGTTNIAVTLASEGNTNKSPDSNAAYGISVGYDWEGNGTKETVLTLKNAATVNVDNTAGTILGTYGDAGASTKAGHQLTGVRIYRSTAEKSTPIFNAEKQLTINVEDKTTAQIGDYLTGIYVAGDGAQANLTDSNITVNANGKFSSALKIGKPNSNNGATINSTGKMVLDTSKTKESATVRLFDNKSRVIADSTTATTEIKSANSAIAFDTVDYESKGTVDLNQLGIGDITGILNNPKYSSLLSFVLDPEQLDKLKKLAQTTVHEETFVRGTENKDNEVILNNSQLSTNSNSAPLILANARYKKEGDIYEGGKLVKELQPLAGMASLFGIRNADAKVTQALNALNKLQSYFNTGSFNVTNAKFSLKGDKSTATAAPNGWAVYAKSEEIDETNKTAKAHSDLTTTFSQGAKITGLVHQDIGSTLTMNVDNKAVWFLNKKEDETEQRSTAKSVTLSNGGVLDAGSHPAEKYIVKVSSNGADKDGTFTNDHGIITLANQSYADKLTIEGNYVGNNGILKTNTEWNLPGDENGANSQSDLLEITGDASGKTEVISVSKDGREKVIDGSIASIVADSYKISAPVVRVLGTDNGVTSSLAGTPFNTRPTFTGTARTTGAGEVQLASRVVDGKTEYFWTVTAVKLTPPEHEVPSLEEMPEPMPEPPVQPELPSLDEIPQPQPEPQPVPQPPVAPPTGPVIITPSAVAYTLIPRQNLELGYTMLDTLHQRRGENQTLSWDKQGSYWQDVEKQSWGRVIGKHLKLDGKERFGLKTNMYGFQVGHDFDVKTKQDDEGKLTRRFTGLYFGALRSHSKFYDEYRAKNGVVIADKLTSRVKTTALNLGVTDTRYNENGTYIDWVGQLSWLNNRYSSVDGTGAKNHGWGAALSVETGRPYALGKDKTNNGDSWILEPQAQLIAQYLRLGDFNDGTRAVSQKGYGLRGRVGFRLAYNKPNDKQRTRTYYLIGNIWHDFKATDNALIGRDKLTEKFDRTWWELGLGSQFSLSENTYLYADARYEKSFDSNRHKGYQGTVGVKYSWK